MKKSIIIIALVAFATVHVQAQKYFTRTGHISFYSEAPLENIEANNYQANSIIDIATGDMAFTMLIKGFEFEKALMQEHFNEKKYMWSDEYPKASFEGKILNINEINLTNDGKYEVEVEGDMTIRGITNKVKTNGTLEVKNGKIIGKSSFPIKLSDYGITIPGVVNDNIAKVVDVTVDVQLEEYKK